MVISFVCLWLLCSRGRGALPGLTRALILWNLELTAITELLSFAGALHLPGVALFWLVSDVWLLTLTVRSVRHGEVHLPDEHTWEEFSPRSHSAGFWVLAAVSALMVFFALFTVTYNWDSMTYHLPRICQWAQNGTVDHYSTHCVRQISSPVLAEYVMLHLYLLTGKSDVLINLVQCLSAVLCGVYSWGIARKLGVSTAFSRLAAMMTLCMPILFAEAFTAEADIYSSLWMMLFAWLLLDFVKADTLRFAAAERHQVLYLAATVSLGYLAKPSVGIGMLVLAAWMGITRLVKRDKLWDLVRLALVAVPMVLLPMIPTSLRNLHSFHSLQSSSVSDELMVGTLQPRFLLANLLKHIFGNLQNGYIPGSAATVNRIVANLGWILQLNSRSVVAGAHCVAGSPPPKNRPPGVYHGPAVSAGVRHCLLRHGLHPALAVLGRTPADALYGAVHSRHCCAGRGSCRHSAEKAQKAFVGPAVGHVYGGSLRDDRQLPRQKTVCRKARRLF